MLNYCSYYQLAPATLCHQKEVNCTAELVPLVSIPWIKIQLTFPLFLPFFRANLLSLWKGIFIRTSPSLQQITWYNNETSKSTHMLPLVPKIEGATTFSITTLCVMAINVTLDIMLCSVRIYDMPSAIMLSVVMPSVSMLNVIKMNVLAPNGRGRIHSKFL
jgi:hypothetical protein